MCSCNPQVKKITDVIRHQEKTVCAVGWIIEEAKKGNRKSKRQYFGPWSVLSSLVTFISKILFFKFCEDLSLPLFFVWVYFGVPRLMSFHVIIVSVAWNIRPDRNLIR